MPGRAPGEEARDMGRITKYDIARLGQRNFRLEMDCPNCGRARLRIGGGNGDSLPGEAECPKCGIQVILDALSVTVLNERAAAEGAVPAP